MGLNVVALVVLVIFYIIIVIVGLVAAWKVKVKSTGPDTSVEATLVAGRNLNTTVAVFTMIATTVGGGYINGTAESVSQDGLIWTLAPIGIFLGLNIGGMFYAQKMREKQYLTMLDPFQKHYGNCVVLLIYLASLMGDLLWTASILKALGTTLHVIARIPLTVAVLVSGAATLIYTVVGSMVAVAYTDIVQLLFITVGLVMSLPFVLSDERMGDMWTTRDSWVGKLPSRQAGVWGDLLVAMTLGTIPWQSYFQRVLSVRTAQQAKAFSFIGALGAVVMVIPSVVLGVASTSADWSNTTLRMSPKESNMSSLTLPLVIHEFCPVAVSILGLGAISAAVMSSMDSAVLGTSSMFTHNIYHGLLRPQASNTELRYTQITSTIFFGGVAMAIALWSSVIYGVFILAADIVFVIIFPQLTAVLYCPKQVNYVGAIMGYFTGLLLRVGAGEPVLDLPVWLHFFLYDERPMGGHLFPFRTFSMLMSFLVVILVSGLYTILTERLQKNGYTFSWLDGKGAIDNTSSRDPVISVDSDNDISQSVHESNTNLNLNKSKDVALNGSTLPHKTASDDDNIVMRRIPMRNGVGDGYEMGSLMVDGRYTKFERVSDFSPRSSANL